MIDYREFILTHARELGREATLLEHDLSADIVDEAVTRIAPVLLGSVVMGDIDECWWPYLVGAACAAVRALIENADITKVASAETLSFEDVLEKLLSSFAVE